MTNSIIKSVNFLRNKTESDFTIIINGKAYSNFLSIEVDMSMETLTNSFKITLASENAKSVPFSEDDEIIIYLKNTPILTGTIEILTSTSSISNRSTKIQGRDKTSTVVDSDLIDPVNISGSISLKDFIETLLRKNQIEDIQVLSLTDTQLLTQNDNVAVELGQNLFSVIDEYCQLRQVLAYTNGEGNIVLSRSSSNESYYSKKLVHRTAGFQNDFITKGQGTNVMTAVYRRSKIESYKNYVVQTRDILEILNLPPLSSSESSGSVVVENDTTTKLPKTMVLANDKARTLDSAQNRAKWEKSYRLSKTRNYFCDLDGLEVGDGVIWKPNTIVKLEDDWNGLDEYMLIKDVSFNFDTNSGSQTSLTLIDKGSYK